MRHGALSRRWAWGAVAVGCVALAAASLLLPASLSYDPWAWLVWGREVLHLDLSTRHGPSWKPLPVGLTTIFNVLPRAAPSLWLVTARAALVGSLVMAGRVAWRLAGRGEDTPAARAAAIVAVLAVGGCTGLVRVVIDGTSEGLFLLFLFAAAEALLIGRLRIALALGCAAGLVRPEIWSLLAAGGVWLIVRDRRNLPFVALLGVITMAAWVVPDWLGSGDVLRALHRSAAPDPGSYVVRAHPVAAVVRDTWHSVLFALAPGVLAVVAAGRRPTRLLLAAGVLLEAVVVAGVATGEAGSPRYLLAGAAAVSVAGAVGSVTLGERLLRLAARRRPRRSTALVALGAALLAAVAASLPTRVAGAREQADQSSDLDLSARALPALIARAGGRRRLLAICGRPTVGRYRITLMAWELGVPLRSLNTLARPRGVVFQERLGRSYLPAVPSGTVLAVRGRWRVLRLPCRASGRRLSRSG